MNRLAVALAILLAASGCSGPASETSTSSTAPAVSTEHAGLLVSIDGANATVATPAALAGLAFVPHPTMHRGGEPNIGITPSGDAFVTAGPGVLKSSDAGKTWTEVFNLTTFWGPAYNPEPTGTVGGLTRSSDDMLWVDPDTGRIFADFMTGLYCSKLFWSDDEGATWTPSPVDCGVPVNDHQKVMTAPWGPDVPMPATSPVYPNLVYYCYNKLVSSNCAVSYDGGITFNYDRAATIGVGGGGESGVLAVQGPCGGINGHPAPAPDGTVYLPLNLGCPGPVVMVTTDNGATWTARSGPTTYGAAEIDPDITVTPDGTAYMLWRGGDDLQYLARSKDRFATWDGPWRVSPPDVRGTVFTAITSGDDGRIAMAFLGTRDPIKDPSSAPNATRWHLYNVVSLDAGAADPTFTAVQVTPDADPVQIGCVWLGGGGNPCRNMLDFIDLHAGPDGRAMTVFTDGCTTNCANNPEAKNTDSRSRTVTVAVLEAGPTLRAAAPKA